MNSRAFTIAITPTDVSTAQDVAEISVPSNKAIEIEEIEFRFTNQFTFRASSLQSKIVY